MARGRVARFRVVGFFEYASRPQAATITIDRTRGLFSVRPLRRRRVFEVALSDVAHLVVRRILRAETEERRKAKRAARRKR